MNGWGVEPWIFLRWEVCPWEGDGRHGGDAVGIAVPWMAAMGHIEHTSVAGKSRHLIVLDFITA